MSASWRDIVAAEAHDPLTRFRDGVASCVKIVLEEVREMVARFEFGVWADDVRQPEAGVGVALLQVDRAAYLLYVQKLPVAMATAADCEYVYTGDIFRLVESPTALFAGCIGDFNGDGRPDMALLMKRQRDGRILPVVFRSRIDHITNPYGFNEDTSVWPGPFCHPKPPNGVFESEVGGKATVVG